MAESKKCVACETEKPLNQFYRDAKSPDQHRTWCKACWSQRNEMLQIIAARLHRCTICGVEKARTEFRWNPKFGLRTECKECERTFIRCCRCGQAKTHDKFPPSKKMSNGRHGMCSDCWAAEQIEKYHTDETLRAKRKLQNRSERAKAWRRQYYSRPDIKARDKARHSANTTFLYHNDVLYRLRVKARSAINHALKTGKVVKPDSCQSNGKYGVPCEGRLEAHHWHGYWPRSAWLDVEWLCVACHKAADEQLDKNGTFGIVFRDPSNPVYAAIAKRVDNACNTLGIDEEKLFAATLECAGEDECDTFLKVIHWLAVNGYELRKAIETA